METAVKASRLGIFTVFGLLLTASGLSMFMKSESRDPLVVIPKICFTELDT